MKFATIMIMTIVLLTIVGCTQESKQEKQLQEQVHADSHLVDMPYEEISDSEIEALGIALNDEYKARAIYKKVLDKFGEVKPFSNIINAETTHAGELIALYEKYDLDIPKDNWYDKVPEFDSVTDACAAGVRAEIENADLYDELFLKVDNKDITAVFTSLRDASREKHLPAFQRCGGGRK